MFRVLGADNTWQVAILISVVLLVALSPLGNEATKPATLFIYRSLLFTIAILSVIEIYKQGELKLCPGFAAASAALLAMMWFSYHINTGSRFEGSYLWYQHFLFGAAFLGLAVVNTRRPNQWKAAILTSIVLIDVVYLLLDLTSNRRPISGPFVNANYFASFLIAGFAITVAYTLFAKSTQMRIATLMTAVLFFYGFTQAWSRGAVLAAAALTVAGVFRLGNWNAKRNAVKFGAIGALALSAVLAASPALTNKFLDLGEEDPYNYTRPRVWMATIQMIAEYPLFGVGLGQFDPISIRFAPPVEGTIGRYMKRIGIAHSEYLQYAGELGIPAAVLMFTLAGYLVWLAIRRARTVADESRIFHEAAILTAAGLGAHAIVDNNWSVPVMAAGLVVFSVADVLPRGTWNFQFAMNRQRWALVITIMVAMYLHSTVIPAAGLHFNDMGLNAFQTGDLDRAESHHRLAAGLIPDSSVLLENTGLVYFERHIRTGDSRFLDDAENYYRRAVAADPNAPRLRRRLEAVLIQRLTGDPGRDRKTNLMIVDVDRKVLEGDPFNPFVRRNLAEALYHAGKHVEAQQELSKAIELEPNYVSAYLRLAEWQKESGNIPESENQRSKAESIVAKYQHITKPQPYEALLLGRSTQTNDPN